MFSRTRFADLQQFINLNTIVQFVEKFTEICKIYTSLPSGNKIWVTTWKKISSFSEHYVDMPRKGNKDIKQNKWKL